MKSTLTIVSLLAITLAACGIHNGQGSSATTHINQSRYPKQIVFGAWIYEAEYSISWNANNSQYDINAEIKDANGLSTRSVVIDRLTLNDNDIDLVCFDSEIPAWDEFYTPTILGHFNSLGAPGKSYDLILGFHTVYGDYFNICPGKLVVPGNG